MQTYHSAQLIQQLQNQTESLLNIAIQQWQMITPAKFKRQPGTDTWSAMQCIGHLNAYGDYYLPAIKKGFTSLIGLVHDDGKVGWTQPIGADPRRNFNAESWEVYGAGAYLLAGSEVVKLKL